jgi:hypothetical protein
VPSFAMSKHLIWVIFIPTLVLLALAIASYSVRCFHISIDMDVTSDVVRAAVTGAGTGEVPILAGAVHIISPTAMTVNDAPYADDSQISIRPNGATALTLRILSSEEANKDTSMTLRLLQSQQKQFEVATSGAVRLLIISKSDGLTVRGSDGHDHKLGGQRQLRATASAVRFDLAESSPSYPPFAVTKLSFVDFDQFSPNEVAINGLRGGKIRLADANNTEKILTGGDLLKIGINSGQVNALQMSDDGLHVAFSGSVNSLKVERGGIERDWMPTWFEWAGNSLLVEVATLLVTIVAVLVAFVALVKPGTAPGGYET